MLFPPPRTVINGPFQSKIERKHAAAGNRRKRILDHRKALKIGIKWILGAAVTIVIVWLAMRGVGSLNPLQLLSNRINWNLAALSAAAFLVSAAVHTLAFPLGAAPGMPFAESWRVTVIGNAANMVLPLKMGDGLRLAFFPKKYSALRRGRLLLFISLADGAVILLEGIAAVLFAGLHNRNIVLAVRWLSILFAALCAAGLLALALLRKTGKIRYTIRWRGILKMTFWVGVSWSFAFLSFCLALLACGFGAQNTVRCAALAMAGTNFATIIPSSPGGIGLFEYAVVVVLGELSVPAASAKAAGLLLHVIQYAVLLPAGLLTWLFYAVPLRKRKKSAFRRRARPNAPGRESGSAFASGARSGKKRGGTLFGVRAASLRGPGGTGSSGLKGRMK